MARVLFVVQGEGRGHMTQAITLQNLLHHAGHQLVAVLVGKSPNREIPQFFYDQISCPIKTFSSPNFVMDKHKKAIKIWPTITYNLQHFSKFRKSLKGLAQMIKDFDPDVIINFYDLLAGIHQWMYKDAPPMICIGHQYLLDHPDFEFPSRGIDRWLLLTNSKITAKKAVKKLALSFRKYLDDFGNTVIVPPLIREIVRSQQPTKEDFLLVYVNNDGYGEEIKTWHAQHRDTKLHCFWDRKGAPEEDNTLHPNITFHQISAVKFLEKMRTCQGFVTTAGFESVCEAMYLGKPVMMVPVEGHFEQQCNALDGVKAGAGISNDVFDLSALVDYIPLHQDIQDTMQQWVDKAPSIFIKEIEEAIK